MFEWAVGDIDDPHEVAKKVLRERRSNLRGDTSSGLSQLVEAVCHDVAGALEESGFAAHVDERQDGLVVEFEDADGIMTRQRRSVASHIIEGIATRTGVLIETSIDDAGVCRSRVRRVTKPRMHRNEVL